MDFLSNFDTFHEAAIKATGGLSDFGSDDYQEGLRRLLSDYDKYARFGDVGVQMMTGEIVGNLVGRLLEEQGFKTYPEYTKAPIQKPIIIVGMARTGTTALHRLISQDPATQALPLWLACAPMPRPPRETWETNPAYQQVDMAFEQLYQMSPMLKQAHPMIPAEPDECRFATNHSFCSPSMAASAHVPEYAAWVTGGDARHVYRRYRKVLGMIANGSNNRWILKDPSHLWLLPALLDVFPDACIVMTHRDPVKSVSSVASITYQIRKLCEPGLTPEALGKESLEQWSRVLNKAEKDRAAIDPSTIFDIHFDEIKSDPVGSVERIYQYFDLPISDEARACWRQRIKSDPNSSHGVHLYKPADFGLSDQDIYAGVGAYYDRYVNLGKAG